MQELVRVRQRGDGTWAQITATLELLAIEVGRESAPRAAKRGAPKRTIEIAAIVAGAPRALHGPAHGATVSLTLACQAAPGHPRRRLALWRLALSVRPAG